MICLPWYKQLGVAAFFLLFFWLLSILPGKWLKQSYLYLQQALSVEQKIEPRSLDWTLWSRKISDEWNRLCRVFQ